MKNEFIKHSLNLVLISYLCVKSIIILYLLIQSTSIYPWDRSCLPRPASSTRWCWWWWRTWAGRRWTRAASCGTSRPCNSCAHLSTIWNIEINYTGCPDHGEDIEIYCTGCPDHGEDIEIYYTGCPDHGEDPKLHFFVFSQ